MSIRLIVLFKSSRSLLAFPLVLSITGKRILKFLIIIMDLSISPFISVGVCFTYTETLFLGVHTLGLLSTLMN